MSDADDMVKALRSVAAERKQASAIEDEDKKNYLLVVARISRMDGRLMDSAADLIEAQAARIAELERERDWPVSALALAERILLNLGHYPEPSKEPGADPRRDRISLMLAEPFDRATAAEAERDRLRAALAEIRDSDMKRGHPCEHPDYGHCGRIADVALAHAEPSGNPGRLPGEENADD